MSNKWLDVILFSLGFGAAMYLALFLLGHDAKLISSFIFFLVMFAFRYLRLFIYKKY